MDYKVTNDSGRDIYLTWSIPLLDEENYQEWSKYTQTTDFLGDSSRPEEMVALKAMPVAQKLQQWVNDKLLGVPHQSWYLESNGVKQRRIEYKMLFAKDEIKVMNERQVAFFKANEKGDEIYQKTDDKSLLGRKIPPQFVGYWIVEPADIDAYEDLKINELRAKAKAIGLKVDLGTSKDELKRKINDYEGNSPV